MPVNVIGTLKPKNNGKFPVAEAVDIKVTDDLRLDEALENKADLSTVNFALAGKANTSDVTTSTANLQAQIDQIAQTAGAGTADTEIAQARVGADGTSYQTLKARLDTENAAIKDSLSSLYTDSYNLYNIENELEDTIVYSDRKGVESNSSYNSSNWVEDIEPNTTYTITNCRRVQYLTSAASGRTFISAENGTSGESLTFTTPATCECINFSYPKDATNVMLLKGTEVKGYIPYGAKVLSDDVIMPEVQSACIGADGTVYSSLKNRIDAIVPTAQQLLAMNSGVTADTVEDVSQLKTDLYDMYTDSYNLYNIENELENTIVFVNKKGAEENSGYNSSDWVEGIKPNTTYTITDCRRIQFLTDVASGRLFISSQEGANGQPLTFTTPSTCACIAFSYQKSATNIMLLEGSEVKEYVPYGAKILNDEVVIPEKEISNNWLSGKTIAVFGDSIMYGDGNSNASVGELLAAKYGMTLHKYAQSGATIGIRNDHPTGRYHIPNQIAEAIEDGISPDIVIFNGGTNDENGETPTSELGTIPDDYAMPETESSFSDGLQSLAYQIKSNWENTIVIYIRAHNMASRTYQRQVEYGERGIAMCEKWGFGIIDMFKIMNTQLTYYQTEYLADTTHPNGNGYKKYYMPAIERYLHDNNPNDYIYT